MSTLFSVTAFYRFSPISSEKIMPTREQILAAGKEWGICGLVLVGSEGLNGTVAGAPDSIQKFKEFLLALPGFSEIEFKDSETHSKPFRRFCVDLRKEIVTLKEGVPLPDQREGHLSPQEWQKVLDTEKDIVLIDTRNIYETQIGKFKGAIDPKLTKFSEFPSYVENSGLDKNKKILMYCTGGIRCEKAYFAMKERGFREVYQLDGGILKYLEEFPDRNFEGECFVFDHRVAVDQKLNSSTRYKLCPHCGNPGEKFVICVRCDKEGVVCEECFKDEARRTCSKNCAHHARRGSRKKSPVGRSARTARVA